MAGRRNRMSTEAERAAAERLYRCGGSFRAIAKEIGVSEASVRSWARKEEWQKDKVEETVNLARVKAGDKPLPKDIDAAMEIVAAEHAQVTTKHKILISTLQEQIQALLADLQSALAMSFDREKAARILRDLSKAACDLIRVERQVYGIVDQKQSQAEENSVQALPEVKVVLNLPEGKPEWNIIDVPAVSNGNGSGVYGGRSA